MVNLSGIDLEKQGLPEKSSNKAYNASKVEIKNTERHVVEGSSNVDVTPSCDILNSKTTKKVRIIKILYHFKYLLTTISPLLYTTT